MRRLSQDAANRAAAAGAAAADGARSGARMARTGVDKASGAAATGAGKAGQLARAGTGAASNVAGVAGSAATSAVATIGSTASVAANAAATAAYEKAEKKGLISKALRAKEVAKARLLEMSASTRQKMLESLCDMVKELSVADPYMWNCVKSAVRTGVDAIFADLEHEVERNLKFLLLEQKENDDAEGDDNTLCYLCLRVRAFFLHHYLPHDRSIFGKMHDCIWWLMTILTILPIYGVRVIMFALILLMLVFPWPPDEFQLITFILSFKGTQFLTSGIILMAMGAMQYFTCYSWFKTDVVQCIEKYGPGSFESLIGEYIDYIGSILLVWIAFCALPCSEKIEPTEFVGLKRKPDEEEEEDDGTSACCCCRGVNTRGGRLRSLLFWDMFCFLFTVVLLIILTLTTSTKELRDKPGAAFSNAQFRANLFWCRVAYALLSFPFVPFVIPVLSTILTHSDPTGYNEHGKCVAFDCQTCADLDNAGGQEESDDDTSSDAEE